ncbi:hypothetical protein OMAG_002636, partial [Candidatus Omnitrophus magneticus]
EYVAFLVEKEKKHRAFVERILNAEKEPSVVCKNIKELMQAIDDAD